MKKIFFLLAVVSPLFLASCGGNKTSEETADTMAVDNSLPEVSAPEAVSDTVVSNTVELTGDDLMKFNRTEIRVKAGEQVTLSLKNIGKLPKEAMSHNFVLLKLGTDTEQFALKAAVSQASDYIPADMKTSILSHTKLLGPGESDTITFTVPAGEYEFICSFPGHWGTMRGKVIAL
ncbi:plastocyanin/azurin family copper-binding protein [Daejeonella oryzae]|uniref:plastocyanin/azurin family copper-binding protein n=1 Tax=Daejeonella oryzae TaxID=1122943 RepID=UPI00041F27F0|nr:azurin [Daejeonella oryzae]